MVGYAPALLSRLCLNYDLTSIVIDHNCINEFVVGKVEQCY